MLKGQKLLAAVVVFHAIANCYLLAQNDTRAENTTDILESIKRLEQLDSSIYTATSWNRLAAKSKEYSLLIGSLTENRERLMQLGEAILKSESDDNRIRLLRSMRVLGMRPDKLLSSNIVDLWKSEDEYVVVEGIRCLIGSNAEIPRTELLFVLSHEKPRVKRAAVELICDLHSDDIIVLDAVTETLHDPLVIEEFVSTDFVITRDLREDILLTLGLCKVSSNSLSVESQRLLQFESPLLRAAALSYRCATMRKKDSSNGDCAELRRMAKSSELSERINAIRCGIKANTFSPQEQYELLRNESMRIIAPSLRYVAWQDTEKFHELVDELIAGATNKEIYHLSGEVHHIAINGKNIQTLARRLSALEDGTFICRRTLLNLIRSSHTIDPDAIKEFKNHLQRESQSDRVRNEFGAIDAAEIYSTRLLLAGVHIKEVGNNQPAPPKNE